MAVYLDCEQTCHFSMSLCFVCLLFNHLRPNEFRVFFVESFFNRLPLITHDYDDDNSNEVRRVANMTVLPIQINELCTMLASTWMYFIVI